jgi:hypothetical protein
MILCSLKLKIFSNFQLPNFGAAYKQTRIKFMKRELSLVDTKLLSLSAQEMNSINGGNIIAWLAEGVAALEAAPLVVAGLAIAGTADALYDFSKGVVAGWNSVK